MADAMLVCDSNGWVTFANEAAVRMTGVDSVDELKGPLQEYPKRFQIRYLDGTPIPLVKMSLSRALAGESVVLANTIIYNVRTGKDLYLRVSSSPIRDETGAVLGSVAVCTDVSELIEFDRMKDQFLRVAAHELKTPVTIMKGNAQMLLRFAEGIPSELRRGLESINRGADRITRIVDALLDVSQLHLGCIEVRRERVDLAELVDLVARRMALTTKKHQLRVVANAANLVVQGDYSRLEQVLLDMKMPVMDGWKFALAYRTMSGDPAPIVVVTAAEDARKRAEEIGAVGWIGKPFELDVLLATVQEHTSHGAVT
jgi:PAS domain S-box-containing protein